MAKYIVTKKVVSVYEVEVEANFAIDALRKVEMNIVEGGELVDDYYLNSAAWDVREAAEVKSTNEVL